jgi:hypothetical protein
LPVHRRGSAGLGYAGAAAAPGREQSLLLEFTVRARDRADGDPEVTGELAQRRESVAGAEPSSGD